MAQIVGAIRNGLWQKNGRKTGVRVSIAKKLILSFLLVIFVSGAIFTGVGILVFSSHVEADAREQTERDLEAAQEVLNARLGHLSSIVLSTADNVRVKDAVTSGNMDRITDDLLGLKFREALDILTVTDETGSVLLRATDLGSTGDVIRHQDLISTVMATKSPVASTVTLSIEDLDRESPILADRAYHSWENMAGSLEDQASVPSEILMLGAAAPIVDYEGALIGVVESGVLINTNRDLVCEISQAVFSEHEYKGKSVGFITIYQDDVGIVSCPQGAGETLVGSPIDREVYDQVVDNSDRWIGRDDIGGDRYVTVYEPITDSAGEIVGILQVGKLEQVYLDIRNQIIIAFVVVTLVGALVAMFFAYFIARRISNPIRKMVAASSDVAHGDLEARIDTSSMSNDELAEMAIAFNAMASALEERDEALKEMAAVRIGEAERLALIGQLAANIAHELNNPLTGIVTYSHLLVERTEADSPSVEYLQKIVVQADRCRDIIRGLLEFARQREPVKTLCDVNVVLHDSISLLEHQALFHNIKIEKDFDAEIPLAIIDPAQIERVFINVIINAAEAMEGSGLLTLSTGMDRSGDFVEVKISDTGPGIVKENRGRIFDPFFTTKEVGKGTGLGLAISYGIVKEHGGTISVESKVGRYTTFRIRLPVKTEVIKPIEKEHPAERKELLLLSDL